MPTSFVYLKKFMPYFGRVIFLRYPRGKSHKCCYTASVCQREASPSYSEQSTLANVPYCSSNIYLMMSIDYNCNETNYNKISQHIPSLWLIYVFECKERRPGFYDLTFSISSLVRAKFYAAEIASAIGYLHSLQIIYRYALSDF